MDLGLLVRIAAGLVCVWLVLLGLFWVLRPKGVAIAELIRLVPDLLRLLRSMVPDASVPLDVRLSIVGLLVWLLSPIDLIPEFIPVLGPMDDVVVAIVVLRFVRRRMGVEELRARWPGTPAGFALLHRVLGATGAD